MTDQALGGRLAVERALDVRFVDLGALGGSRVEEIAGLANQTRQVAGRREAVVAGEGAVAGAGVAEQGVAVHALAAACMGLVVGAVGDASRHASAALQDEAGQAPNAGLPRRLLAVLEAGLAGERRQERRLALHADGRRFMVLAVGNGGSRREILAGVRNLAD